MYAQCLSFFGRLQLAFFFSYFLAAPHGMWDLSSGTRNRTVPPAVDLQGNPHNLLLSKVTRSFSLGKDGVHPGAVPFIIDFCPVGGIR